MTQTNALTRPVVRRKVFYIPGFDPAPPRRYRELYRKEARKQAAISGYAMEIGARRGAGSFGWSVSAIMKGKEVRTEFEVLVWSDIVRASMGGGVISTYLQLLRTAWIYVSTGTLFRLAQLRKGPVIAALYPIAALLAELGLAACAYWLVKTGLIAGLGWALETASTPADSGPWLVSAHVLASGAGLVVAFVLLRWFKAHDGRIFAYYLMHDYAFTAEQRGAYPGALEARMAEFRTTIADALAGNYDEVLVVGHSSGAHLAVSILADILREKLPQPRPALGLLSLGQVVPMVSFLPKAQRLRGDLQLLSIQDDLTWVDVTAPGDGCAFALCDPVSVSGLATSAKRWPLVISAAFTRTLSPARWKALRWRFFRLHFQYLCAFDQPGIYDYFAITAGPQTLASRFASCNPSKSRNETATSAYRTVSA